MPKQLIKIVTQGPYYRFTDKSDNLICDVHQDLKSYGWRVYYPSGVSNLHVSKSGAVSEAIKYLKFLGYEYAGSEL